MTSTTKYRHLFFDLDHTLWDFDANSAATLATIYKEHALAELGIVDFGEFHTCYMAHNDKLWERFRKGYIKRDELRWKRMWHTLLDFKIPDTALAHRLSATYLEVLPTQTLLMPHAKELLDHCSGRYELHLITNGFETTQWQKLRTSGIDTYFTHVITSERSNSMKPYREIYDFALKMTAATVENSIMIGDALEIDVLGAINAGWDQVYYNPKQIPHTRKPTYEIAHLQELTAVF